MAESNPEEPKSKDPNPKEPNPDDDILEYETERSRMFDVLSISRH